MQYVEDSYYRDIAYHTAIHAADTVHGVHFFISRQVVCMCVYVVGWRGTRGDRGCLEAGIEGLGQTGDCG